LAQARVVGPAVAVKADFRTALREDMPFVLIGLARRHLLEFRGVEPDALAPVGIDSDRTLGFIEPCIADGHEKPVWRLDGSVTVFRNDQKNRSILDAIDDEPVKMT
jgi:hypothetical protein